MRKCFATFVAMFAITMIAYPAQGGDTFTWTNGAAGNTGWRTADNWDRPAEDGYPIAGDTAIIASASGYPTSSTDETVAALTINSGAELTVTGFDLTIDGTDGLKIVNTGELIIDTNEVRLKKGGLIHLDGTITLTGGGLQLHTNTAGSSVYAIPDSATGEIVGGGGVIDGFDANRPVLVVGAGVKILGKMTIDVTLVNNGEVHADREGDLVLGCNTKAGNGLWKVSTDTGAKLLAKVSVAGGPDSIIEIEKGIFEVTADWVSCGSVWMLEDAGKIMVGGGDTLRTGTGGGECVCGG